MEETKLLNGLQAVELMQQGKMVIDEEEDHQFKIINGNVCYRLLHEDDNEYRVESLFDFSAKYKEYIEPKPLTGWERVDKNIEDYFSIAMSGNIQKENKYFGIKYDTIYDSANAFSTKEKAEEINFKQTLFRKLQRFSDKNGSNKIDWNDDCQAKYFIYYDHKNKKLKVNINWYTHVYGKVYFISREVAEKAVELFHDELIKYFTM